MKVVSSLNDLRKAREDLSAPVGIVPTMGYLHAGHLSLVQNARKECAGVIVTIFVNPAQFGPKEDLSRYPRDLDHDLELLEKVGVDLVWTPVPEDMYPPDFQTWVQVEEVSKPLEGALRPGHFRGVATIVAKLFNATQPHKAYFGQKDAQQAVVIRKMVRDLNYPIDIRVCPICREPNNLAMSSRNIYLSPEEHEAASVISRALFTARDAFNNNERNAERLRQIMQDVFSQEPRVLLQYASCADPETLQELDVVDDKALLSVAVFVGKTRLIDNVLLP